MKKRSQAPLAHRLLPSIVVAVVVLVWLAPIILGRMPIGGDVTSFFLPLMSYYRTALIEARIPIWNELWGFGFPMLAESQAGVFYPPHILLYRLFETETAYSLNIVLHTLLAGWFAYFCAREFDLSRPAAAFAAIIFAGNGFFIIHFPHQWSYTTGCWLPLAVALAWRTLRELQPDVSSERQSGLTRLRSALWLALVLAVQMLAGHFQIAFYTQITVLVVTLVWLAGQMRGRLSTKSGASESRRPLVAVLIMASVAGGFVLAAVQLLPTRELIRIALPEGRDFEYLSGFANTPFHWVSYVLPTLFHVNPLWRPLAWDPLHTSPEENFSYVGLLPICLAMGAAWRWRREPRVRIWVWLLAISLVLSLGPYEPLFRGLIRLPGFDGFRSAARWSVVSALFLALLAGRGLDGVRAADRLRSWIQRLTVSMVVAAVVAAGVATLFVHGGARARTGSWTWSAVEWACRAWDAVSPWDRGGAELLTAAAEANRSQGDVRVVRGLAELGYRVTPLPGEPTMFGPRGPGWRAFSLGGELRHILVQELLPPFLMLGLVWLAMFVPRWRRVPAWFVLSMAAVDLGAATWLRPTDFAPRTDLVQASPILGQLAATGGDRVFDPLQNLAMAAGAAPINSYRTVDIPFLDQAVNPQSPLDRFAWFDRVQRRLGVEWEVWEADAEMMRDRPLQPGEKEHEEVDRLLGRLLYGETLVQLAPRLTLFVVRQRAADRVSRAWFWSSSSDPELYRALQSAGNTRFRSGDFSYRWLLLPDLQPVSSEMSQPTRKLYRVPAERSGALVIADLAYPGWRAVARGADDNPEPLPVLNGEMGGCQLVPIPAGHTGEVELTFRSPSFERGRLISVFAFVLWLVAMATTLLLRVRTRRLPSS